MTMGVPVKFCWRYLKLCRINYFDSFIYVNCAKLKQIIWNSGVINLLKHCLPILDFLWFKSVAAGKIHFFKSDEWGIYVYKTSNCKSKNKQLYPANYFCVHIFSYPAAEIFVFWNLFNGFAISKSICTYSWCSAHNHNFGFVILVINNCSSGDILFNNLAVLLVYQ